MQSISNHQLPSRRLPQSIARWLSWFVHNPGEHQADKGMHEHPWWKVTCLTGVDYFSTLGYQPGIAFLAAGLLAPVATLILVAVTILAALPVYRRVAALSPHGQGSISMLEKLVPGWNGKFLVLGLLGFAATDFIITITLSASDAAAHVVENPFVAAHIQDRMGVTMLLIVLLGAVFLRGFKEAISVSVALVGGYLLLNTVVIGEGLRQLLLHPQPLRIWHASLLSSHGSVWSIIGMSLVVFPKLALGLSGFETGVAVMPLVRGEKEDTADNPQGRVGNTKRLLTAAALVMGVMLLGSSLVTTTLVPSEAMAPGGAADGRALAYLAHHYLGHWFGTAYDAMTVLILWFAGASAMAALINIVPRYLPRFGMAPEWARASRPLVCFFVLVGLAVTYIFDADVNAQGGAYATGVLVLITSAALAVTLALWKTEPMLRLGFSVITLVFGYTTVANMIERPDGLTVALFFIVTIFVTSFVSRAWRATELRIDQVSFDTTAHKIIKRCMETGSIRLLAHKPDGRDYSRKLQEMCELHSLEQHEELVFLEVSVRDASDFTDDVLQVKGVENKHEHGEHRTLKCESLAVANAIARLLLHLRDQTGIRPDVYFGWTEGTALSHALKFVFLGAGETGTLTRSIIRQCDTNPKQRPRVHVA